MVGQRLIVVAHVGVIDERQGAQGAAPTIFAAVFDLELEVLGVAVDEVPVERDAVGHGRHQHLAEARLDNRSLILDHQPVGVTARIRCVIPGAVVVDGPVHELQMAVGAGGVDVEEIGGRHLADAQLEAMARHVGERRDGAAIAVGFPVARQRNHLVYLQARHVGLARQRRIAHDVEVGEAGDAERRRQAAADRHLGVDDDLGRAMRAIGGEHREQAGDGRLGAGVERVGAAVGRGERRVRLEDGVDLGAEPERLRARVIEEGRVGAGRGLRLFGILGGSGRRGTGDRHAEEPTEMHRNDHLRCEERRQVWRHSRRCVMVEA